MYINSPLIELKKDHQEPLPHEFYNFGRTFFGHHYYILSLCDLCLGVEKKIFKGIMQFHCMTYMATSAQKNPCPRRHEIYNFGRPFLGHHDHIPNLIDLCLEVKKKIFKGIIQFHCMTYMATSSQKNPCPRRHEIYNFGRPFLGHHDHIPNLIDLCLELKKKIFKEIMHFHYMNIMATP